MRLEIRAAVYPKPNERVFRDARGSFTMQQIGSHGVEVRDELEYEMVFPSPVRGGLPTDAALEDASPFGVQALMRDELPILKEDCVNRLAFVLATRGTRAQIRDPEFVRRTLARYPDWIEEYRVVHLIEKSLWIHGQSDLVMTLAKNPSQIPDDPPAEIHGTLARANVIHPDGTIWYGVPLFGDEATTDGLPIPLTAAQVRAEHAKRIAAAQRHALRWGWAYRIGLAAARLPSQAGQLIKGAGLAVRAIGFGIAEYGRRVQHDNRRRARAVAEAEREYCRYGRTWTQIPEHTTELGRIQESTLAAAGFVQEKVEQFAVPAMIAQAALTGVSIASLIPPLLVPLTVIPCDPFLFIELPGEPGKLRFLGHWYWQGNIHGQKKLHLHV